MRSRLILLATTIFACTGSIAFAQDDEQRKRVDTNGLIIEATLGWDGFIDTGNPVPVSLLLVNSSDRIVEGRLFLVDPDKREIFLDDITLAQQTTRRFATIRDISNWFECYAEFRSLDNKVLWRRELSFNTGNDFSTTNKNFVLLVDDSGRRLILPKKKIVLGSATLGEYQRVAVAGKNGRDVVSLNAKSWQIPDHPAALVPIQAIVFPEALPVRQLNRLQWRCVAEWICEGGTVFVHKDSQDVVSSLVKASPLSFEMIEAESDLPVRAMGLGQMREYGQQLFSSAGKETSKQIADQVRHLAGSRVRDVVNDIFVNSPDVQTEAQLNRIYVAGLFGIYTLFIGLFALLMFRFSRRKVAIYTVFVVTAASIAAGAIGVMLKYSRGDLKWASVTYIGAGGAVQFARLDIQSSGGRNENVAIKGLTPDLQFTGERTSNRNASWYGAEPPDANPPFDLQTNQFGTSVSDAFQVKVRMTPWGRRQLHALDYKQLTGLDLKLTYTPDENDKQRALPSGDFQLEIGNPAGLQVGECWLLLGVSRYSEDETVSESSSYRIDNYGNLVEVTSQSGVDDGMVDTYQTVSIRTIPVKGKTETKNFKAAFRRSNDDYGYGGYGYNPYNVSEYTQSGRFTFPRLDQTGTAKAWLFAVVGKSPILQIDEANTEFVPHNEVHLVVQEISPANMPDAALFFGKRPQSLETEEDDDSEEAIQDEQEP